MIAIATLIAAVATLVTALSDAAPLAAFRGWLRDRTTRYDRMIAAQGQAQKASRLILHLHEGLEGVQRPFDRDELMREIWRHIDESR